MWESTLRRGGARNHRLVDTAEALVQFENRVRKRYRHLLRWAKREQIDAFRVYDRDIPEIAYALDIYGPRVLLQRYSRDLDGEVNGGAAELFAQAAARATGRTRDAVSVKVRRKINRREEQHEKSGKSGQDFVVSERGARFWVNLDHYVDTGLFLDHRDTRLLVRQRSNGAQFLNLFCYTGSFTVHAAQGRAAASTSVDMSNTYLTWAQRNFALNGLDETQHQLVRANVIEWLREARAARRVFDLIVLDPPAFSSSKRMQFAFDVQRDHETLIRDCADLLDMNGTLIFSTNLRGFKLHTSLSESLVFEDLSEQTIPEDFRDRNVHKCWLIRHRRGA